MRAEVPPDLLQATLEGRLVVVLGEELNSGRAAGGLFTSAELLDELLREYPDKIDRSSPESAIQLVAGWYSETDRWHRLLEILYRSFSNPSVEPTLSQRLAVGLAGSLLISLGWGHAVENAIRQSGRRYNRCVQISDFAYSAEGVLLFVKAFGCIDQKDSVLVTDAQMSDFQRRHDGSLDALISTHLLRTTVLLLGVTLHSPFLVALSAWRKRLGAHAPRVYIVDSGAARGDAERWSGRGFKVVSEDALAVLQQLVARKGTTTASPRRPPVPVRSRPAEPFKFLDYYGESDTAIFFGRLGETERLLSSALINPITVLVGASGVGKTSLLLAGLVPRLTEQGCKVHVVRALGDPTAAIRASVLVPADDERSLRDVLETYCEPLHQHVFAIDQFEEFFLRASVAASRQFAHVVNECVRSDSRGFRFVFVLREDFLHHLLELDPPLVSLLANRIRIHRFDELAAREAILRPAELFQFDVEEALLTCLCRDLADSDGSIDPAHLQVVCYEIYRHCGHAGLRLSVYRELGGAATILATYLDEILASFDSEETQAAARAVLKAMVTDVSTKTAITAQEIANETIACKLGLALDTVRTTLVELVRQRVVRPVPGRDGYFEIAHETLVQKISMWLEPDDIRVKYWRRALAQVLGDHRGLRTLPTPAQWREINEERDFAVLGVDDARVVAEIGLHLGGQDACDYWLERGTKAGVDVWELVRKTILEGPVDARIRATEWVAGRESPYRVEALRIGLFGPQEAVRRQVTRALSGMSPGERDQVLDGYSAASEFVEVPAGGFILGTEDPRFPEAHPAKEVMLGAFAIQRYPVTNYEYLEYVQDKKAAPPRHWRGDRPSSSLADHPVVEVSWYDASAYAEWFSSKSGMAARLPTVAEWEKAGGWSAVTGRKYLWSWGDDYDETKGNTRVGGPGRTTPIGEYSPAGGDSPLGVADMSGNTFDWVQDWWARGFGEYAMVDPVGPADTGMKAARGGSWAGSAEGAAVVSQKYCLAPETKNEYVGFRLVVTKEDRRHVSITESDMRSEMIEIDHGRVALLAQSVGELKLAPDFSAQITPPSTVEPEASLLTYLWAAAICHGTKGRLKGSLNGKEYQGWDYLLRAFCGLAERRDERLRVGPMSEISEGVLRDILGAGDPGVEMNLEDVDRRAEILRCTAADLLAQHDGSVSILLGKAENRVGGGEGAYALLARLRGFQDPLQKKSSAFLMTVHYSGLWRILDQENVLPMIDYHRMRLLLRTGCIVVRDESLLETLRTQKPVEESVGHAIRASAMAVCRELVQLSGMAMFDFDVLLWAHARSCCRKRPLCISGAVENGSFHEYLGLACDGRCVFQGWCPGAGCEATRSLWEPALATEDY